jgi:hypothetical protein
MAATRNCMVVFQPSEMTWIRQKVDELNDAIRRAAEAVPGATYIDVIDPPGGGGFSGHELCTDDPWIRGLALPAVDMMHPTAEGHRAMAEIVRRHLE